MKSLIVILMSCLLLVSNNSDADGAVVDKIYHPYVLPNEIEFEWRISSRQFDQGNDLAQWFSFGTSIADNVMLELYLVGERDEFDDFSLRGYEIETRWMLTEQGQYWADWGAIFEIERQNNDDNYEVSAGVIFEKEFDRSSLTMNAFAIYEWGNTVDNELETQFRAQWRYRWIPQLQPAIEFYQGEGYTGIGPAFMGIQRYSGQRQLKWEVSFITAIDAVNKDHTFRLAIEYEF